MSLCSSAHVGMDRIHDTEELHDLLEVVDAAGETTIDVGLLVGLRLGPQVSVRRLLSVVSSHSGPEVRLSLGPGRSLTVLRPDGEVLAVLEVAF